MTRGAPMERHQELVRLEAQSARDSGAALKEKFQDEACVVALSKQSVNPSTTKEKPSYQVVAERPAFLLTGKIPKSTKQVCVNVSDQQAERQCRLVCEAMYTILSRELRNLVYDHLVLENNGTFYTGSDKKIKLANGLSPLQHCFDAAFTGPNVHKEINEELNYLHVSFDFRHNHQIRSNIFEQYKSTHGFELVTIIDAASLILNLKDTKSHEEAVERLQTMFQLRKDARIRVYIACVKKTQPAVARSFGRVLRIFVSTLGRMKQASYEVTVIMNSTHTTSNIKNSSESGFSIIRSQLFPYSFPVTKDEPSVVEIEKQLDCYFAVYGDYWNLGA